MLPLPTKTTKEGITLSFLRIQVPFALISICVSLLSLQISHLFTYFDPSLEVGYFNLFEFSWYLLDLCKFRTFSLIRTYSITSHLNFFAFILQILHTLLRSEYWLVSVNFSFRELTLIVIPRMILFQWKHFVVLFDIDKFCNNRIWLLGGVYDLSFNFKIYIFLVFSTLYRRKIVFSSCLLACILCCL